MARGASGRIVLEIEPKVKEEIYQALEKEDLTLKEWFLKTATSLIKTQGQMPLYSEAAEPPVQYKSKPRKNKNKASRK
jgi:hypothetical protein